MKTILTIFWAVLGLTIAGCFAYSAYDTDNPCAVVYVILTLLATMLLCGLLIYGGMYEQLEIRH